MAFLRQYTSSKSHIALNAEWAVIGQYIALNHQNYGIVNETVRKKLCPALANLRQIREELYQSPVGDVLHILAVWMAARDS